jgi:probable phosphoglycerate mutase
VGELRLGTWEGRALEELRDEPLWGAIQRYPSGTRIPGGETLREVQARAVAAVESLLETHADHVVAVVSHGDVIKALVAHYAGMHLDLFQRISVAPASLSVLRLAPEGPRLLCVNDTGSVPPPPEPPTSGRASVAHEGA